MAKSTARLKKRRKFSRTGAFYVYIVLCNDGTLYTGYTPRLKNRVKLHNAGKGARYTKLRRPVRLVWHKKYKYFKYAFKREIYIKTLSRDEKKNLVREEGYGWSKVKKWG